MPDTNSVSPASTPALAPSRSHLRGLIAACFLFVGCVFGLASPARGQQPAPLVVDADEVVYDQVTQTVEATGNVRLSYRGIRLSADHATFDLRRERLVARGRVVLIDARGRELRGEALTYDLRLDLAELTPAETIVDRVYIRSDRVQMKPEQIIAHEATVTTCDPARPAYRVTASQLEIIPGDRIVARRATLWLGRFRVFTVPVYVISLRTPEETAGSFPRVGYNNVDGLWVDYRYVYPLGSVQGTLYTKYGTMSGFIAHNTLAYRQPGYGVTLIVGRNQNNLLKIFDHAEVMLHLPLRRIGAHPMMLGGSVSAGWFAEAAPAVSTSRLQYSLALQTLPIPLGTRTTWQTTASWQDAFYGTGAHQSVLRVDSAITHQVTPSVSLTLSYRVVEVSGATPFIFDAIPADDRIHRLGLQVTRSGERGAAGTSLGAGVSHNFRDGTMSVNAIYGERVPERYHWGLGAEYNLGTQTLKLSTDSGLSLGRGTYFTVAALYNTTTRLFEDLDFTVTSRVCDCIDVTLRYRQVRQEIWLEIGLSAFPATRLQLQFPRP